MENPYNSKMITYAVSVLQFKGGEDPADDKNIPFDEACFSLNEEEYWSVVEYLEKRFQTAMKVQRYE